MKVESTKDCKEEGGTGKSTVFCRAGVLKIWAEAHWWHRNTYMVSLEVFQQCKGLLSLVFEVLTATCTVIESN